MPTPKKGYRLGGSPSHQRLILANLASALFEHGRITTTEAKARMLRPYAEKLITKAKKGDLHNRREVLKTIHDKSVVHVLFTEIGPTFAERPGGYTRITKIGPRKGDNAPMAVIELVTESYTPSAPKQRAETVASAPASGDASSEDTTVEVEPDDSVSSESVVDSDSDEAPRGLAGIAFNDDVVQAGEDGSGPEGFEIKGNADSGKYHTPASQWYDQTIAEVWFRTEEAAEAAGFTKAG